MDQFRKDNEALQENLEQRKLKSLADVKVTTNLSLLKSSFGQSLFCFVNQSSVVIAHVIDVQMLAFWVAAYWRFDCI